MAIRIFISGNSGNPKISCEQQTICSVLDTRNIGFETIDIAAPGMEIQRDFMRKNGMKREGQRNVLPPQIFNGETFRGDFVGFDIANEDDVLEEFLGLPRKHAKVELVNTGAIANEESPSTIVDEDKKSIDLEEMINSNESMEVEDNKIAEESAMTNKNDNLETANKSVEISTNAAEHDENKDQYDDDFNEDINDNVNANVRNSAEAIEDLPLNTFKEDLIQEAMKSKTEEVIEKTDGLSSHFQNDIIIDILEIPAQKNIMETDMTESIRKVIDEDIPVISNLVQDGTSDSDDESDMSESEDEFMPDGERIRKTSRGFKQISNCKRFWRASMLTG